MKKYIALALVAATLFAAETQSASIRRTNVNINVGGFRPVTGFAFQREFRRPVAPAFAFRPVRRNFFAPVRPIRPVQFRRTFFPVSASYAFRRDFALASGFYNLPVQSRFFRSYYSPGLSEAFYQSASDPFPGFAALDQGGYASSEYAAAPQVEAPVQYEYHYVRSTVPLRAGYSSTLRAAPVVQPTCPTGPALRAGPTCHR